MLDFSKNAEKNACYSRLVFPKNRRFPCLVSCRNSQLFWTNGAFLARFSRKIITKSMIFSPFLTQFRRYILQISCVELLLVRRLALTQELPSQTTITSTFLKKKAKSQLLPTSPKSQKSVTV